MQTIMPTLRVLRLESDWTIECAGDYFDRFGDRQQAIRTATRWASNAAAQGAEVRLFVPDQDGYYQLVVFPARKSAPGRTVILGDQGLNCAAAA